MRPLLLCALLLCVAACIPQPVATSPATTYTVSGDVSHRERMALPENANLWVQLIQTDALGRTLFILDEYEALTKGQSPVPFSLTYDGQKLYDQGQYALLARILYQNQSLFANAEPARLSLPTSTEQHLVLSRVAPQPGAAQKTLRTPNSRDLTSKRWELRTLYNVPVERFEGSTLPGLFFDANEGRVIGNDGCNSFNAPYVGKDASLDIGLAAATMKMCFNGMEQARALTTALHEADNWRISGNTLELRRADRLLASFEGLAL